MRNLDESDLVELARERSLLIENGFQMLSQDDSKEEGYDTSRMETREEPSASPDFQ